MKKIVIILVLVLTMLSCGKTQGTKAPSEQQIPTKKQAASVEVLQVITSTSTVVSTNTSTYTPTATFTPIPTETSTPTFEPPTQTAVAKTSTQQKILADKTATAAEKNSRATGTAEVRSQQRTATQHAKDNIVATTVAQKTMIASYKTVEVKKLNTYPFDFVGQKVRLDIKIFHFVTIDTLQGWMIGGYYNPVIIHFRNPYRDIYDNEIITVFGVVSGTEEIQNIYGADVYQVAIEDAWFKK